MKAVLFRPTWEFLTTGALFTFLFVTTWWRDNFASDQWKKKLELKGLLPHWHPAIWLCFGLMLMLVFVLWRGFQLSNEQENAIGLYRAKPIPEFVIDLAKEGDEVVGFKIRNVSSQNLFNVAIVNIKSRVGEIAWWENFFPCLEARIGEKILKPHSYIGETVRFSDVPSLLKALQDAPGEYNPEYVGDIVTRAVDGDGNRFAFSTRLELWNSWTWRVWETERTLLEAPDKPSS